MFVKKKKEKRSSTYLRIFESRHPIFMKIFTMNKIPLHYHPSLKNCRQKNRRNNHLIDKARDQQDNLKYAVIKSF